MAVQSIIAIFQKGVLKPLTPLNLTENEKVEVHITRSEKNHRPVIALSGVWKGLGDPTYEEIVAVTRKAHQIRLKRFSGLMDKKSV